MSECVARLGIGAIEPCLPSPAKEPPSGPGCKRILAQVVRRAPIGVVTNEVFQGDGAIVFKHACALGCEGFVSKRLGSSYKSGRSAHWIKVKNPVAQAVRREAEEEWAHWAGPKDEVSPPAKGSIPGIRKLLRDDWEGSRY